VERGRFITIEGGEGAGKTTQIAHAVAVLRNAGLDVLATREPGGTALAERIRAVLLHADAESMPETSELLLMFAARGVHLANLVLPALQRGTWVVCDRFTDATYAYQGGGRGLPVDFIRELETRVQGSFRPDLTLLLDAPVDVAMARARARNADQDADRFEREHRDFFERVRAAYLAIARAEPSRVRVIDATAGIEHVSAAVQTVLSGYMQGLRT